MTSPPSKHRRRVATLAAAWTTVAALARADVDVRALVAARGGLSPRVTSAAPLGVADRHRFSTIIELPEGEDARRFGLPRLGSRFSARSGALEDLDALSRLHPDWRFTWSPPLRPLLDRAAEWTRAGSFRNATGLTGKDVLVGVIDTGADLTHRDLRHQDGTTRVAYIVDFGEKPLGLHPEAEAFCIDAELDCAVLGKPEIDRALASADTSSLPVDEVGHGTHVASLAAGSGGADGRYVGSAPGATLVIAKVGAGGADIGDASVLLAAQMMFSLAESEGRARGLDRMPAVVNLSLGSDFGPHDGTSSLERGLAELVGPGHPGRAIVVAAGNSAGLASGNGSFPQPLGIHTEVHLPGDAAVRVPLVTSPGPSTGDTLNAAIYVWINHRPGDDLRVGVDRRAGKLVSPQGRASAHTWDHGELSVTIVNDALEQVGLGEAGSNAAVVIIEGTWDRTETFAVRLEGRGTANLWVQAAGDLGPATGGLGALVPAAFKESTVTSPATSAALIAVGATVNRTSWTDRVDDPIRIESLGSVRDGLLDSVAYFSSAGPTADQRMKPDLVAPGAFVAGAMSIAADPADSPTGIFREGGFCRPITDCSAIDATHGVALGTSMAAPIVSGAVALLFERDPSLTQDRIRALLQAGVRRPEGTVRNVSQMGPGALDLEGTLDAMRLVDARDFRTPSEEHSWLAPGDAIAHPDPGWHLPFALVLRDESGRIADVPDSARLDIDVQNGRLATGPDRVAPGFYQFDVAADRETGGASLTVEAYSGGARLAGSTVPIGVDYNAATDGFAAHGGCAAPPGRASGSAGAMGAAIALIALRGARRTRAPRKARSRDRTDTWG